jgi:hypothetical protein
MVEMDRRHFLALAGAVAVGLPILGACEPVTRVDFGSLVASGVPGLYIPEGFTARKLATSGSVVKRHDGTDTAYTWHPNPDGGAVFPVVEEVEGAPQLTGWVYTSNRESSTGGCGAIKFDADGNVIDAYSILSGSANNCAGGIVPTTAGWRWVSCEEREGGLAWECDPTVAGSGVSRPAMGRFVREAVATDVDGKKIYQTEDRSDGGFYRFTPTTWGDLSSGSLEVMTDSGGVIGWATVPDPDGSPTPCRDQVATMKVFNGGEGCWASEGHIYFTTKGDNRLWRYTPATNTLTVIYDDTAPYPSPRHLTGVDNVVATTTNRAFVAEDGGNMEIVGVDVGTGATYPVIRYEVSSSEVTGPAFSLDGSRLYFSSQRNPGETFEVTGPWNQNAPAG